MNLNRFMPGAIPLVVIAAAIGQSAEPLSIRDVAGELRQLRIELAEYRLESGVRVIRELEQELNSTISRTTEIAAEERSQSEQLTQIDSQITDPNLNAEMRAHAERLRNETIPDLLARRATEAATLRARQTELNSSLERAKKLQQAIAAQIRTLSSRP